MAEFYRDGQIIARRQLGVFQFRRTKDIRLLVVVENGANREKPMTHEASRAVQDALEVLGRRFPVRNGVGPLDGFQSNGLRYRINPDPLSVGFDGGSILEGAAMEQILDEFNERQAARLRPDRADFILSVRVAQDPSDAGFGNQQGRLVQHFARKWIRWRSPPAAPIPMIIRPEMDQTEPAVSGRLFPAWP